MTVIIAKTAALFLLCWGVHIVIWRIRRPNAYPLWLLFIFVFFPMAFGALFALFIFIGDFSIRISSKVIIDAFSIFMLHISLSGVYAFAYPFVISFSPTLEILKAVYRHMPNGAEPADLKLPIFNENTLIGTRIRNLIDAKMVIEKKGIFHLTGRGQRIAGLTCAYRRLIGLEDIGLG